ncbi:recombinase family protein [Duodenibacillus massiliensis]|uniref:recombinase family protein n=1 Tax=Duodenibacillus massiliensis TaxID=1852381 RepID=UPI0023A799CC|nr:recombinase family protein [Duodenibacillus massiliensis]
MIVGYIRVSTLDQNADRQHVALNAAHVEKIYEDHISGANTDRAQFQAMMQFLREGDELVVLSLDRLARNLRDLLDTVETLGKRGVSVRFLKENLLFDARSNADPTSKLMLSMVGAFAEFERSMIRSRQAEGIALAKARGAYKGRPRSVTDEQISKLKAALAQEVPLTKATRKVGISRTTAYRYLAVAKQLGAKHE